MTELVRDNSGTHYDEALERAFELFNNRKIELEEKKRRDGSVIVDRCRIMVFFTDGMIEKQTGMAKELDSPKPYFHTTTRSDICSEGGIADSLDNLDVESIAVSLRPNRNNNHLKAGIPPSFGSLLALTGDIGSSIFQEWYNKWGQEEKSEFDIAACDRPGRSGVIIGVDEVERLPSVLERAVISPTTALGKTVKMFAPPGHELPAGAH